MVMRHAKSAWNTDAPTDHDRPLNKRGRKASPLMGTKLRELGWTPEVVIASDAQRTRETWARTAPELPAPAHVRFTPRLYFSGMGGVLEELATTPDDRLSLLTLGHNPTWEHLVLWLCGQTVTMKTANIALLEADLEHWADGFGTPGHWRLMGVLRPR